MRHSYFMCGTIVQNYQLHSDVSHRERTAPLDNAKCRKLDHNVIPVCELAEREQGILADHAGNPLEPDSLFFDFMLLGVPMELAIAEAWMTTAKMTFKSTLQQEFKKPELKQLRAIFNFIIRAYLKEQEEMKLLGENTTSDSIEKEAFDVAKVLISQSVGENTTSDAIEKEAFDVAVSAFLFFRNSEERFKYSKAEFCEIVENIRKVLLIVMETEVAGPWQTDAAVNMEPVMFEKLLMECVVVKDLREIRNTQGAHCWNGGSRERRRKLLALLNSALKCNHPLVIPCKDLIKVAATTLEERLKKEENITKTVEQMEGPSLKPRN